MSKPDRLFWLVTLSTLLLVGAGVWLVWAHGGRRPQGAAAGASGQGQAKPAARAPSPARPRPSAFSAGARWRRKRVFAQVQGAEAFVRLPEPREGDWLWSFREPGQTLQEYAREVVNRKRPGRETLHLLPFSDLKPPQRRMLRPIQRHTALYFDTAVRLLPPRRLRRAWYHRERQQFDADRAVRHLATRVPADSLGLFGLTGADLYGLGLNYVFGEALLAERAGIYSLHRYGEQPQQLLRRALKLSAHEIGHLFGLKHCVFYACVMNGVNSLAEMDRSPLHLCPVCLAKLQWNLRFEPQARYRALGRLYAELGLEAEARFVRQRALEVAPTP